MEEYEETTTTTDILESSSTEKTPLLQNFKNDVNV